MNYLAFTEEDSFRAHEEWDANCGPHALATGLGVTLDRARELLPLFEGRAYTTPKMMAEAIQLATGSVTRLSGGKVKEFYRDGIWRVQWEGRWTQPGVPAIAAYPHTHWVTHFNGHIYCTCCPHEWWPVDTWKRLIQVVISDMKGVTGWHLTHCYPLPVPKGVGA